MAPSILTSVVLSLTVLVACYVNDVAAGPVFEAEAPEIQLQQLNFTTFDRIVGELKSTYHVSTSSFTLSDAIVACHSLGLKLLSIETEEEWTFLRDDVLPSHGVAQYYWTSGIYDTELGWHWHPSGVRLPSPPQWVPWQPNHPINPILFRRAIAVHNGGVNGADWLTFQDTENIRYICESIATDPTEPEPCDKTNDMIVVLDSSGSIGEANYEHCKDFVAQLAGGFNHHPESREALTAYSTGVHPVLNLPHGLSREEVDKIIREDAYIGGSTNTAAAIANATLQFYYDGRSGVPQNLVVVTDGVSDNLYETILASVRARNEGITTFAVGIGPLTSEVELVNIAGDPTRMYRIERFDQLPRLLGPVSREICERSSR